MVADWGDKDGWRTGQPGYIGWPIRQPYAGVNYIPPFRDYEFGYSIRTGLYASDAMLWIVRLL